MKNDGILIDMQNFDHIHVSGNVVNVGAGLTFEKVFKVLNKNDRTIIHGQCLQVGVVGYTIHGGVHFGSLSNVYGLGSDNVVGVSMVLYNGSVVDIYTNNDNSIECLVDNVIGDNEE
jgi:FAD/FMN-containing dehydrogenase